MAYFDLISLLRTLFPNVVTPEVLVVGASVPEFGGHTMQVITLRHLEVALC